MIGIEQNNRQARPGTPFSLVRVLDWRKQDFENRLGFRSAKYTDTRGSLTFALAFLMWAALYGALAIVSPAAQSYVGRILTERGPIPYATVFVFFWALSILLVKYAKLRYQRKALDLAFVPRPEDFTLTPDSAYKALARMRSLVDDPKRFVLLNRIDRALANLHNMGRVSDVSEVIRAQAENDEDHLESSYVLVRGFIWAIPILGFIGTVLGLSSAIGHFGAVLSVSQEPDGLAASLGNVTGGLATAFDTTLLALCFALLAHLAMTGLKKKEELFLDDCKDYCHAQIVSRLRMIGGAATEASRSVVMPEQG